jgi:hypothetical protein
MVDLIPAFPVRIHPRIVRRLLVIAFCLGICLLIWLWRRSGRPEPDLSAIVGPRPVYETRKPASEPVPGPEPADTGDERVSELVRMLVARAEVVQPEPAARPAFAPVSQSEPVDGGEHLMAELIQVRAEAVDERRVTESPLRPVSAPKQERVPQAPSGSHGDGGVPLDVVGDDGENLMAELARIRADVVERVERRPFFVMAERRGVPFFQLFSMTKQELFEAVLEAEGLPPHDVTPSPPSAARIREIAAEALHLHEEIAADAHLLSDQTA